MKAGGTATIQPSFHPVPLLRPASPMSVPHTSALRSYTLSDFDFQLPPELIAQHPSPRRSGSRLLDATGPAPLDRVFRELPALLRRGDLLVFNDTRVIEDAAVVGGAQRQRSNC